MKKIIMSIAGTLLIWLTFFIMDYKTILNGNWDDYVWLCAYSIVLIFFTFFIKISKVIERNFTSAE
ncbi:MAG: hypothetical protein WDN26_13575 [Chitinophagaceae bacterium]